MNLSTVFSHWNQIHEGTLTVLDCFSDTELSYTPYDGGWSVGQIALHITNAEEGWFRTIAQKEQERWPSSHTLDGHPTKESIKDLLKETHTKTMAYLKTLTIDDLDLVVKSEWGNFSLGFIIWHVIEHEIHHRGELSLILGVLGRDGLDV